MALWRKVGDQCLCKAGHRVMDWRGNAKKMSSSTWKAHCLVFGFQPVTGLHPFNCSGQLVARMCRAPTAAMVWKKSQHTQSPRLHWDSRPIWFQSDFFPYVCLSITPGLSITPVFFFLLLLSAPFHDSYTPAKVPHGSLFWSGPLDLGPCLAAWTRSSCFCRLSRALGAFNFLRFIIWQVVEQSTCRRAEASWDKGDPRSESVLRGLIWKTTARRGKFLFASFDSASPSPAPGPTCVPWGATTHLLLRTLRHSQCYFHGTEMPFLIYFWLCPPVWWSICKVKLWCWDSH